MEDLLQLPLSQSHERAQTAPRVLVVTPVGLHGRGGIDRLNLYLHGYLEERGGAERFAFLGARGERRGPFWLLTFMGALLRFAWLCLGRRFDLAHIHVSTDGSAFRKAAFGAIARLTRRPYVIHYHGMMSAEIESARPLWLYALAFLARGASRVLVLGEAFRKPFERLGVAPDRIAIVYNGIPDIVANAEIPRRQDRPVHIVFSGELGERKGSDILIKALGRLGSTNWRCTVAGNGDVEAMRRLAQEQGILDRVAFTGWVDIARVHDLMRDADIVALPSRAEALPLSLIEGASAGAALVATDVGAVRDIVIEGVNGCVVRRDESEMAAALAQLIEDAGLRASMQIASRQIYRERFQLAHCVAAIIACQNEAH